MKSSRRLRQQLLGWFVVLSIAGACSPDAENTRPDGTPPAIDPNPERETPSGGSATGGGSTGGGSASGGSGGSGNANSSGGNVATGGAENGGSTSSGGTDSGGTNSGGTGSGGEPPVGPNCGYQNRGHVLEVTPDIRLCMPPTRCLPETCPPGLGKCVNDKCVFEPGYKGVETLREAWATQYCDLAAGTCNGVRGPATLQVVQQVQKTTGLPQCKGASASQKCVGIVASPPMMVGNHQKWKTEWGQGLTEPSGLCYELTGNGGSAIVAITDRCGGYCTCSTQAAANECGPCAESSSLKPTCPCVGSAPPLYGGCCGRTCGGTIQPTCDWCASSSHPHFDLDDATFAHVCGPDGPMYGSCKLKSAKFVQCMTPVTAWPPE